MTQIPLGAGRTVTASGESATKPIKDIAKVGSYLDFAGVPVQNRRLVLNPSHKVLYATDDNLSKVSYAGDGNARGQRPRRPDDGGRRRRGPAAAPPR